VLVAVFVPVAFFPRHDRIFFARFGADHRILDFDFCFQRADPHARASSAILLAASMQRKRFFLGR
jgi:hypothetical protein